jgi:chemotaxis protein MotB
MGHTDDEDTNYLPDRKPKRAIVPWIIAILALGGSGYFFFAVHQPMADQARQKDATIAELTKMASDAKADAEKVKALTADLAKAQDDLKQVRDDLAQAAAHKADDDKLLERLKKEVGGGAEVNGTGGQIMVTMVDRILFKSGEADLSPQGEGVLRALGNVLSSNDKLIEVCGHADNQAVESAVKEKYPTNWELSTARATNVVRFLQEQVGLKARRLKAAGYGASRPIASNATPAGRAKNRRIEILLLPDKVKVVKGDFSDEIAQAKAQAPKIAAVAAPKTKAPPPKAVAVLHPRPGTKKTKK